MVGVRVKGPLDLGLFTFKKSTVRYHVYTHIQLGYDVYVPKATLSCEQPPDMVRFTLESQDDE